jgi:integrase
MAWLFQDQRQKKKLGDKAPWSVGWCEGNKRKSKQIGTKQAAKQYKRKIEGQMAAGLYRPESPKVWKDFRTEFETRVVATTSAGNQLSVKIALDHFERLIDPSKVRAIVTATIDDYVAKRRAEEGEKGGKVSPATVNKELRHIRAALRVAHEYHYLPEVPKVRMIREPEKLLPYVTPEHFAAMYRCCDVAKKPKADEYPPGTWWRALLTFAYMTGWRIREITSLRWDDVLLDKGHAITRHKDNKGKRDELVPLHPVVVQHLRPLVDASIGHQLVFRWPGSDRRLWDVFREIQEAAGIHLECHEEHEHSPGCHVYGFHDLRRAFATCNAEMMTADALQKLMRHKDYSTTKRYINMANQLTRAVEHLHVPDVLKGAAES